MTRVATSKPTSPSAQTAGLPSAPTGRSIVACAPLDGPGAGGTGPIMPADAKFYAIDPGTGQEMPTLYLCASPDHVEKAGWAAWNAFYAMKGRSHLDRAALLERIAGHILDLGDPLLAIAADETGLGPARLVSERDRTVFTLRMFAELVREGSWVEATIDTGQPSRRPTPKPDLRSMLKPLGPVAVFGAGNFPLAYSTAGGDTASALAAGCPVIVKGHPGHPGTGELVARAVAAAVLECGFDPGTFSFLHSGGTREIEVGQQLARHPAIRAVGFTGSVQGGLAIARAGADRPDPIPVFAEMGSTNPVFVLPGAAEGHAADIAERLVASATASGGQMCTCPGLVFCAKDKTSDELIAAMTIAFKRTPPPTALYPKLASLFSKRLAEVRGVPGVDVRTVGVDAPHWQMGSPIRLQPALLRCGLETFKRNPTLHEEIFGPAMIVVVCERGDDLIEAASSVHGSLTGTIWAGAIDEELARRVQLTLEQRVGRLIFNGVPTGVEVAPAMVHGGPFPATNQPHSTAVGSAAIRRWCRAVCYQNTPETFLPPELRNANPLKLRRLVNGAWVDAGE